MALKGRHLTQSRVGFREYINLGPELEQAVLSWSPWKEDLLSKRAAEKLVTHTRGTLEPGSRAGK